MGGREWEEGMGEGKRGAEGGRREGKERGEEERGRRGGRREGKERGKEGERRGDVVGRQRSSLAIILVMSAVIER